MAETRVEIGSRGFGATLRRDAWWTEMIPVILLLGMFGIYATVRAFEGKYYWSDPYLSPFYSPLIDPDHHWWPLSPALLILAFPLAFRLTCYYYRKAYYRAFFMDPPACAVGEPGEHRYRGETSFPFILQNLHRYAFYIAVIFLVILWYDALVAFWKDGHFFVGVGSLVLLANVILLTGYTCGCHSLRHLIGGKVDCFSCAVMGGPRRQGWRGVSRLNEHHMLWAWCSLISVGSADLYVRLVASKTIVDVVLWPLR
ncbi:MAG TPA: hypothetical protein VEU62_14675 [Bryobacterales bacterium]|nr:hypothetical protein [Bryobacterales bacterium]